MSALLGHAAALRAVGGASLSGDAATLRAADEANAAAITVGMAPLGVAMPAAMAAVPAPTLPAIPTVESSVPMTGEQIASLVHAGPGPGSLRAIASDLRDVAGRVSGLADDTRSYGALVDQHWQDGLQRAGANVAEHADWLDGMHAHLSHLAAAADESAGHAERLIQDTPHPEEFADLRQRLRQAVADFNASRGLNPAPVAVVMSRIAATQAAAVAAHQTYAAAATTTTGGVAPMPTPAPPIVRAGGSGVSSQAPPAAATKGGPDHGHAPGGADKMDQPGQQIAADDPAGSGPPLGAPPDPPLLSAAGGAPGPGLPGVGTQIAGELVGLGTGALGQAAGSLRGLGQMPLSALSALSSGMPHMPQMPGGGDGGMPDMGDGADPRGDGDHDFGSGATTPATGAGGAGAGGGGGPVSGPAVSGPVGAVSPSVGTIAATMSPQAGGIGGAGGMGMFPPMFGGRGAGNQAERNKAKDRRVVIRPTPNSEPVFGELERQPPSARRRLAREHKQEETP